MLIDTDVIILYMRGNKKAYEVIENNKGFNISVVTYIELVQGMRNKNELSEFKKALKSWNSKILFINEEISLKAMFYIERHYLSHSLQLADGLIGATALVYDLPLLTGNIRHYRAIKELSLKAFHP